MQEIEFLNTSAFDRYTEKIKKQSGILSSKNNKNLSISDDKGANPNQTEQSLGMFSFIG